jgi:GTP-binding protein HflX
LALHAILESNMSLPRPDAPTFDDDVAQPDDELVVETVRRARAPQPTQPAGTDGDQLDLADRQSLRRISGMSTELTDITEVEYRQLQLERVVLVSVWTTGSQVDVENSMAELRLLAETAGSEVLEGLVQRRAIPDPATYIGSGKVAELRDVVVETGADTVICDGELSPAQLRNLEDKVKVKVIDRTARARPAQLPQAAAARLGRQPVPPGGWPGGRRCGDRRSRTG